MFEFSNILEIIDVENNALELRNSAIASITGLGPPDMCYITREHRPTGLKRFLSRPYTRSYFHYIYGVNTSSLASIAAHFRHFLDNYTNKNSNSKITHCFFCVYDLFSKYDIRVEIQIPGKTTAHIIDSLGHKFQAEDVHWQGSYLSSILRAMYPIRGTTVALCKFFESIEEIENYMGVCEKFSVKLGFVLGDIVDTKKYGVNLLYPAISKYLLRKKRYHLHQKLFKKLIEKDPLMLTFLGKSSIKIRRIEEIKRLVNNQIKITPHAFPLYFTMAKICMVKEEFKQAIQLCQYLLELDLEVYEYWHLLVLCYIKNKDYPAALLCFNSIPHSILEEEKYDIEFTEDRLVVPDRISYAAAGNVWITPVEPDFRPFEDQSLAKSTKEKTLLKKLNTLPGTKLKGTKEQAYKLLVIMEKQIEWDNMLKIKQSLIKKVVHAPSEEEKFQTQNFSSMNPNTDMNKSGFTRTLFHTISHDINAELNPYVDEYLQPAQVLTYRNYFLPESTKSRISSIMNKSSRVQTEATTELFACLHSDLKAVYEWQKESSDIQAVHSIKSNSKDYIEIIPFNGEVWLRRGMLSERLMKNRLAERAYRYVVDKGFSLFAWYRLMKVYVKAGNPKAVLVCIIEVIKQLEQEKIYFDGIPGWMEDVICKMCRGCGDKQIISLSIELNVERYPPIAKAIESLRYWRVDGVTEG